MNPVNPSSHRGPEGQAAWRTHGAGKVIDALRSLLRRQTDGSLAHDAIRAVIGPMVMIAPGRTMRARMAAIGRPREPLTGPATTDSAWRGWPQGRIGGGLAAESGQEPGRVGTCHEKSAIAESLPCKTCQIEFSASNG